MCGPKQWTISVPAAFVWVQQCVAYYAVCALWSPLCVQYVVKLADRNDSFLVSKVLAAGVEFAILKQASTRHTHTQTQTHTQTETHRERERERERERGRDTHTQPTALLRVYSLGKSLLPCVACHVCVCVCVCTELYHDTRQRSNDCSRSVDTLVTYLLPV